ncbi:PepSY-associated TM helix domain-containing protein [Qipengyuania marisflavi]|uniref:PepSY domain-containing protein n=1 Tax=Qipengyuania marisflavi TaxID=2486356 RepID=A0A5S3P6H5_9SPHN|nr:PepSY-associated TM helix domain-containing protein [Qipengyuania marisflavi]TMM48431.1 PepSY domain-containing protein [Qipengyuania marisflavi]
MRKWHRWLSVVFGIFLLFIASTGLLSHFAALWPESPVEVVPQVQAHENVDKAAAPTATVPAAPATAPEAAAFTCPEGWRCRPDPPQTGPRAWVGFFHHLHSGEEFGPVGTALSILSGFALLFFAFSGLWMYLRMWTDRARRGAQGRWFWK